MLVYRCDRCGKECHENYYLLNWYQYSLNLSLIDYARRSVTVRNEICKSCAKDFYKFMENKPVLSAKGN